MNRLFAVSGAILLAGVAAQAGQITIGQGLSTTTGLSTNGLTSSYIQGNSPCAGAQWAGSTCVTGSLGSAGAKNFDASLFNGVVDNGTTTSNAPAANLPLNEFTGYSAGYSGSGATLQVVASGNQPTNSTMSTTSGPAWTFSQMADANPQGASTGHPTSDFWDLNSATSIIVPVGLTGVDQVSTMLNDLYGATGSANADVTVTFNFGTASNNANLTPVVVTLGPGDLIDDAIHCATTTGTLVSGTAASSCPSYATSLQSSETLTSTANSYGSKVTGDASLGVTTGQVYTSPYTGTTMGTNANYNGTTGNIFLNDQIFNFGSTYLSDYLVSIQVSESSGVAGVSQAALSGITVDSSELPSVPEPSTWFMFAAGIGMLAVARKRFAKTA
jgi:hypothetical protein